ncbi:putative membrane protein SpoIIM required for sporulation [Catalinimonas alkaloidigena]|uniref:stage II sporulation protein M n=1 Tax=Catalinimonas alkaloidigena TaxID=1075417 RepID=UPI0030B90C5D|nr:putative membrane protein SpoIIM required for sporulation [Catalinimonas alkaloidigena]
MAIQTEAENTKLMREAAFVKQNEKKWEALREAMSSGKGTLKPDELADYFIQLTDDLGYAKTHYPQSNTTAYLNNLTAKVHQAIYRNKKEEQSRFVRFWKTELPQILYQSRKQMLYSFVIFTIACLIGALSAAHDDSFVRLILGDSYVNMTLENIENNDPMAVYKSMGRSDMFFAITVNNIKVSFMAFVAGIFLSIGTGFVLLQNGIMLGAFQYFFYQKGVLLSSFLTIWIHGTIEISSIIIAGAAGLVIGNSILFPGTYPRMESFKKGARKGMKIVVGLVPLFIIAGFLESFVTRLTDWPWPLRLGIILSSAFFVLYYFVIYPAKLQQHARQ